MAGTSKIEVGEGEVLIGVAAVDLVIVDVAAVVLEIVDVAAETAGAVDVVDMMAEAAVGVAEAVEI